LNPVSFNVAARLDRWVSARPHLLARLERPAGEIAELAGDVNSEELRDHAIIVGYGRVGSVVGEMLSQQHVPFVIVEQSRETVDALRARGLPALFGEASRAEVLEEANVREARVLIVTAPEPFQARAIIEAARRVNPAIDTVVRTHSNDERLYLQEHLDVGLAVFGERELAKAMARYALETATKAQAAS
jgi:CPA2 family monovalent cation:H+ antiporter-2